jgi:hypothetical protein
LEQKLENFKGKGTAPAYGPKLASIWLSVALSLPESFLGQNLPGHLHLPTFLPQLTVVLHTGQCLIWTFNSVVIVIQKAISYRYQYVAIPATFICLPLLTLPAVPSKILTLSVTLLRQQTSGNRYAPIKFAS